MHPRQVILTQAKVATLLLFIVTAKIEMDRSMTQNRRSARIKKRTVPGGTQKPGGRWQVQRALSINVSALHRAPIRWQKYVILQSETIPSQTSLFCASFLRSGILMVHVQQSSAERRKNLRDLPACAGLGSPAQLIVDDGLSAFARPSSWQNTPSKSRNRANNRLEGEFQGELNQARVVHGLGNLRET